MKVFSKSMMGSMVALATIALFGACLTDENDKPQLIIDPIEPYVVLDTAGVASIPHLESYSEEEFRQHIVGRCWYCEATYEINDKGVALAMNIWENMIGMGPTHYYFDADSVTMFYYDDAHANINLGRRTKKYAYSYRAADNGVYINGYRQWQIALPAKGDNAYLSAVDFIGTRSDHSLSYGWSAYRALSAREVHALCRDYGLTAKP